MFGWKRHQYNGAADAICSPRYCMSLMPSQEFLWWIGVSGLFTFGAAYKFSRAVLDGIASARDDNHRATPQSPWYFFDLIYRERMQGFRLKFILWMLLGSICIWIPDILMEWPLVPSQIFNLSYTFGLQFFFLSATGISTCAGVWLWAPRFQSPALCTLVCALPGIARGFVFFMLIRFIASLALPIHAFVTGTFYFLIRDHVRDKMGTAWLRIPE